MPIKAMLGSFTSVNQPQVLSASEIAKKGRTFPTRTSPLWPFDFRSPVRVSLVKFFLLVRHCHYVPRPTGNVSLLHVTSRDLSRLADRVLQRWPRSISSSPARYFDHPPLTKLVSPVLQTSRAPVATP
ncbi:hypothetical protein P175DRAFT_0528208 [Aspergillus ochraceoroseus IBT 24754]|uniref:Uncharacterized protein n=1 Tax=Aspergillus ochraceoroseus IBT 24754 TaxID=1392256 RepID=A0A2T5M846_9EURO|nr:uncharacterized protein P175DRAFT_0528208 [Aspergillus ochraceoroseus IBT 24754]PTU24709.1 hypothetical protein P175DRAFT_0528208 [Aspergillus ochraceoroseus IBT 24754]